jgi:two-component system, OmpR family, phosphate regulon response regulator PhoB
MLKTLETFCTPSHRFRRRGKGFTSSCRPDGRGIGPTRGKRSPPIDHILYNTYARRNRVNAAAHRMRVLLVEAPIVDRERKVSALVEEGYEVAVADVDGGALLELELFQPHLVVLDSGLIEAVTLELCRHIREWRVGPPPFLILVSDQHAEADRIAGFELGADDYVPWSVGIRELMLRVHARLRPLSRVAVPARARRFTLGPLDLDGDAHRVLVAGQDVAVSLLEMRLLLHLAQAKGAVCSRRDLLTRVWQYDEGVSSRTVDTHVKRLRDKLGPAGFLLRTVRGIGYRLSQS